MVITQSMGMVRACLYGTLRDLHLGSVSQDSLQHHPELDRTVRVQYSYSVQIQYVVSNNPSFVRSRKNGENGEYQALGEIGISFSRLHKT